MADNIFSISEELWSIIQGDMEMQAYHIQTFLTDELDKYKGKENTYANSYIKEIQDIYWNEHKEAEIIKTTDKGKQQEN